MTDLNDTKETSEAVLWCNTLKNEITGVNFLRKMNGQTFSFNPFIAALSPGGTWPFYRRLTEVWGDFIIILLGDDFLGRELQAQRDATQSVYALLAAHAEEGEHRGLTMMGMAPSGLSRGREHPPTATFKVGRGGGKGRTN
jgi:hypothetical protein